MIRHLVFLFAMVIAAVAPVSAEIVDQPSEWKGFSRVDFKLGDRAALLVIPKEAATGKPWIWRTEFFGHEPQADLALLGKGFHVAYVSMTDMYGSPASIEVMNEFYAHLTKVRGLSPKVVLEGFSRGGLFAFNWAAENAGKVSCIYVDAPVCDFKSWPGGKGKGKGSPGDWKKCLAAYGLTEEEALEYENNPIDRLVPLAEEAIPIIAVCGDADNVVPLAENMEIVRTRYRDLGGEVEVIVKPGIGHHPHSLVDPKPIVDFVLRHTTAK